MGGAHDIDAINLQKPQPPNGFAQMPDGGAARPRLVEPLRRQR
jgi:hypothetical protein